MVTPSAIFTFILLACALSVLSLPANGQPKTIDIVNPVWQNFSEEDGSGFYFDLMRRIYEPLGIAVKIEILPWSRAAILLQQKKADAMLGSYKEQPHLYIYPKQPVWLDISAAAFKRDQHNWQGNNTLNNKRVGWIRGYDYHKHIDFKTHYLEFNQNHQGWNMLAMDRLDFYIDSITDLRLYMQQQSLSTETYAIEPVLVKPMYLRLAKTEKGQQLADLYDQRIFDLVQNRMLEQLYKKWGYEHHYPDFVQVLKD